MKIKILLLCTILSCNGHASYDVSKNTSYRIDQDQFKEKKGFIEFDLRSILIGNVPFVIYNQNDTEYLLLQGPIIIIGSDKYHIKESNEKELQRIFDIRWFFPEYDIMIAECVSETEFSYTIKISGDLKQIRKNDKRTKYTTFKEFLADKTFQLTRNVPLRKNPQDDSEVVSNYENYSSYQIIRFQDDWVLIEPDKDLYGKTKINGWLRWIKDGEFLINDIYFSY